MQLPELKQALQAADPAALLVPARILRRLLQAEFRVPYLLVHAPHERCYVFDRQMLFDYVEQEELDLEPERLLPPTVILLARPPAEEEDKLPREPTLLQYWQLLFHAHIHLALRRRREQGLLTPADIHARVAAIGQTNFEEIRTVVHQENYLLPPADEASVYIEFAAVYLELRYFRPNLRETYFPAIGDFNKIDELLAQDVNADELFLKTRLPGAPEPVVRTDTSSDESHDYFWRLLRHADRARDEGDAVRAAILRTRAARVAPAALTSWTRDGALADLQVMTGHLQEILRLGGEDVQEWLQVLPALLDKADQGNWPVEARLLYDLQSASLEPQHKLFALDVVEWLASAGKRPIKRPLTALPIVRVTRHLRSAAQQLTMARVSDDDRRRLAKLLRAALQQSEERVRERFRPVLKDAFDDVGLTAANPPEQVAVNKMIEELLDRIISQGFFTFLDLRDTISGNQLKLPDLVDPHDFWRGDALLRLDRRLSTLLEGVYRHGEFYLRWLEGSGALFFGTPVGRFLTRNLVIPFGGAALLMEGIQICLRDYVHWDPTVPWFAPLLLGVFFLALMRFGSLRQALATAGSTSYRAARFTVYDGPRQLWRLRGVQIVVRSWPFLLLMWYVLKPLLVWCLLWLYSPRSFGSPLAAVVTFAIAELLLNSRFGRSINEAVVEAVELLYRWLRFDFWRGLLRLVNRFFKRVTETLELVLYTVDEWLRFRSDENRLQTFVRAVLGALWFPIGYLIRLYFIMLIEPSINPIKLPVSSLAFKVMLLFPLYQEVLTPGRHEERLTPYLGWGPAMVITFAVIIPTLWLLPGMFSFFIWEMKEDWKLFRANRPKELRPVIIGRHGETMVQLLKPGFHSGTIPKLFGQLRRAESCAYETGNWRPARAYRQSLGDVEHSLQLFVEREFVELLRQSRSGAQLPIRVARVELSCNRIRIDLNLGHEAATDAALAFEERAGWLIGSLERPGWLAQLHAEQLAVISTALAGLYKIAGVDFIREQLVSAVPLAASGYDLTATELLVWGGSREQSEVIYDLRPRQGQLRARSRNGRAAGAPPFVDARALFFSRAPLLWDDWVACWEKDREGRGHPPLFNDRVPLLSLQTSPSLS